MITETVIVCVMLCIIFAPYMHAKAYELRERARRMEIENDELD